MLSLEIIKRQENYLLLQNFPCIAPEMVSIFLIDIIHYHMKSTNFWGVNVKILSIVCLFLCRQLEYKTCIHMHTHTHTGQLLALKKD